MVTFLNPETVYKPRGWGQENHEIEEVLFQTSWDRES